jgi:co-chaperonin GroES (HSP10)
MPPMIMTHDVDPKIKLLEEIGNLNDVEIFNNQVLVAIYKRPEKTKSGIILTDQHRDEDRYQSKVGLIIKKGNSAFAESEDWFKNVEINNNDWVIFRPSDGWSISVNHVDCRILDDVNVRGRISNPDQVW